MTIQATPNYSPSVSHLYAQAILQSAAREGVSLPASVCRQIVPGERVPLSVQDGLWRHYCKLTHQPLPGLAIGLALEVGHLDSAGMLLVSCDTLLEGFEALVEYAPVIGDGGEFQLREAPSGDLFSLSYQPRYQVCAEDRVEAVMGSLVRLARWATGGLFQPRALLLAHPPLAETAIYQGRLAVPWHFNAEGNVLRFDRNQARLTLIQANSALRDHLQTLADSTLESLGHQSLSARVSRLVAENPAWGKDRVAAELALSGRHLNRRLAGERVSFKILRERTLHRQACAALAAGRAVAEVAAELQFSEVTAFVRAFRRWQGDTPARFRKQHDQSISRAISPGSRQGTS